MIATILGLLLLASIFAALLCLVGTKALHYRPAKRFPGAQPDLVGTRDWDLEVRPELLRLVSILHSRSGEVLEELKTSSTGDCGELILNMLPEIAWLLGERYCEAISAPQSLNNGLWFQSPAGEWSEIFEHAGKVAAVSFLGRRIQTSSEEHDKLQLNAGRFNCQGDIKMRDMSSLPNTAWVVLRRRCPDNMTLLVSGFISDGVRWDVKCDRGATAGADQEPAVALYDGWAPLLVDNS